MRHHGLRPTPPRRTARRAPVLAAGPSTFTQAARHAKGARGRGLCTLELQRHVGVLPGSLLARHLVAEEPELSHEPRARASRADDVVDEAVAGSGDRGVELGLVVGDLPANLLLAPPPEDDVHRALSAHDGDLRRRPRQVHVRPQVLGGHHVVGAPVGLAGDHRQLRDGGLGVGVQQLGAVLDDAAVLLARAGQEPRYVDKGHDGDVERVAEPHEARRLDRRVDVEAPGRDERLIRHDADRAPVEPRKARDDVPCEIGVYLKGVSVVDHGLDHFHHVVRLDVALGHDVVQVGGLPPDGVEAGDGRRPLAVRARQERQQAPEPGEGVELVVPGSAGDAGLGVGGGPAELLKGDVLVGDLPQDVRARQEHVRRPPNHEREVGEGGRVDGAAGAWAHDEADLRDDAGCIDVPLKHVGVAAER
mmetsp:Transcript_39587/g.94000  ORF Transcript_39587/g.94000 Transcript_39587/m.94000 type:complete len:419 (+) Transcript_39587:368-1624(+)